MPTLFISYKRDDKVAVSRIVDRLKKEFSFEIWIDAVSISGGEDWRAEIRKGIDEADLLLLMLTPDACASPQVKEEVDYARSVGRKILPLQIREVSPAGQDKLGVAHLNYIDFVGGYDDRAAWEKLLNDLPQVLPRDRRLLDPTFRKLHQDYLRALFTRYGTVSLAYLLDAAPRETVKLMDVYVPLFLGVRLWGQIQNKQLVDWWVVAGERDDIPNPERLDEKQRSKQFPGFTADAAVVGLIVEKLQEFVIEMAEQDGERYLWRLESEEAPALTPHLVITGDPGSGKSTLMKHLALCLAGDMLPAGEEAHADRNRLGFWPLPAYTPVFIELRALVRTALPDAEAEVTLETLFGYLRDEQLKPYNIADYLADLRDQMRDGDVMFFLDGLDEIPDAETAARRNQVKTLVALLRGQFPRCRILVTSRPYAYAGDWQLDGFGQVRMAALDTDRLEELALRLFRVVLGQEGAEQEADTFKSEIEAKVPDELRRNPLFFTLLAAIWLNNLTKPSDQRLPMTRSAIYRECVEMLIKRWTRKDFAKGQSLIDVVGLTQEQLRRLLELLAFKLHSEQGDRDDAVFESGTIMTLLRRDLDVRLKDYDSLIEALAQRAGVIYEREPEQFQFAHRSFQEHLAACHLARPEQFPAQIVTRVRQQPQNWRNVVDLLADEANRNRLDLWALVKAWLPAKDAALPSERNHPDWLLSLYAARLLLEHLPQDHDLQAVYRPRLLPLLVKLIESGALSPADRAQMGRLLGEIGDPRPGVGVKILILNPSVPPRPEGERPGVRALPDIAWSAEIPAGYYAVGKGDDAHEAEIKRPYRVSKYLVTQAQYQAFQNDSSARGYACPDWWQGLAAGDADRMPRQPYFPNPNHPMENVNWYQAVAFCRWLMWQMRAAGELGAEQEIRLPTEYEWEVAARGSDGRVYPWGDEWDAARCNNSETGIGRTCAVGLFPDGASPCGALDMSGDVWEWCATKWRMSNRDAEDNDLGGTDVRVLRGGSWNLTYSVGFRCVTRSRDLPSNRNGFWGLRLALS